MSHKLAAATGGFLTWAAKPSVRESPNPTIISNQFGQRHLCAGLLLTPRVTHFPQSKFHWIVIASHFLRCTVLDAGRIFPIAPTSRIHGEFMLRNMNSKGHSGRVFCERVRVARALIPRRLSRELIAIYCRSTKLSSFSQHDGAKPTILLVSRFRGQECPRHIHQSASPCCRSTDQMFAGSFSNG
jgi:hypothetical protein